MMPKDQENDFTLNAIRLSALVRVAVLYKDYKTPKLTESYTQAVDELLDARSLAPILEAIVKFSRHSAFFGPGGAGEASG
jgi:hypothetical protein